MNKEELAKEIVKTVSISINEEVYHGSLGDENGNLYSNVEIHTINKDSILDAYSFDNIK